MRPAHARRSAKGCTATSAAAPATSRSCTPSRRRAARGCPAERASERAMSADEIRTSKPDELRVVNKPLARHDAAEKIAGSTRYAGDFSFTGMLHACLVRSQVPSARLTRRDASHARELPGVTVLFGEDVPNNEVRVDVPGQTVAVTPLRAVMQILATDRVRFHGEPIAIVIAEREDDLAEAMQAVEIEYDPLPVVAEPDAALRDGAP